MNDDDFEVVFDHRTRLDRVAAVVVLDGEHLRVEERDALSGRVLGSIDVDLDPSRLVALTLALAALGYTTLHEVAVVRAALQRERPIRCLTADERALFEGILAVRVALDHVPDDDFDA